MNLKEHMCFQMLDWNNNARYVTFDHENLGWIQMLSHTVELQKLE